MTTNALSHVSSSPETDSTGETIYTPSETDSRLSANNLTSHRPRRLSPSPLRLSALPPSINAESGREIQDRIQRKRAHFRDEEDLPGSDTDLDDMAPDRPSMHRPSGGLSHMPLLGDDKDNDSGRLSEFSLHNSNRPVSEARTSTFRSRSPSYVEPENLTRRKYIYAAFFLLLSLVSFVVQTETAVYIQHTLGWKKAYCMLWLTHSSWAVLWPTQLLILRLQKRNVSWQSFWQRHKYLLRSTAQMVRYQKLHLESEEAKVSPVRYMIRTTAFVTTFLTVAGASWYIAIDLTSPSDLTAIYNCSAFFAYAFSILLLNDKLRLDKIVSVGMAIVGVLVVAYGDKEDPKTPGHSGGSTGGGPPDSGKGKSLDSRFLGNLIIGFGSVLYGLYEVLYKKCACPPEGTSPGRGMIFANTFGSMVGTFTMCVLWIPIPILHFTGLETFELPPQNTAGLLAISTLSNATFSGSFLVLMSLTSPVLSSVAALLTIFLVAIVDWLITGKPLSGAAITGGILIIVAFGMLAWATYREMMEEQRRVQEEESRAFDPNDLEGDFVDDEDR